MLSFARPPFPLFPGLLAKRPGDAESLLCPSWSAALSFPISSPTLSLTCCHLTALNTPSDHKALGKGKTQIIPLYTKTASPLSM